MKNSQIAQTLRSLSLRPALEADTEVGKAEEMVPVVKIEEVGERSELESAETEVQDSQKEDAAVSLEGFSAATKARIRRFFGTPLYTGKLYEKVEKIDEEIKKLEEQIEAVEKTKSVSTEAVGMEGAKWEGVKADLKASYGFMPDPDRPGKTKWHFFGSPMKLAAAKAKELEELEEKKAALEAKLEELLKANKGKVSQESADDESSEVTGDGEQIVTAKLEEAQTDQAEVKNEDEHLDGKTVEVDNGPATEAAETVVEDAENVVVSTEGIKGALKGFLLGSAAVGAGIATFPVIGAGGAIAASSAVDSAMKSKRLKLKQDIEQISKRLADVKNGDIEQAKKEGLKVADKLEKIDYKQVIKSALLGNLLPFYTTYQGHKAEELEIELASKIQELKIEFARAGVAVESHDDCAAEAAANFAQGAAAAAEAAAAAADGESAEETAAEASEAADEVAEKVDEIAEGEAEIAEAEDNVEQLKEHAEVYEKEAATLESLIDALKDAQQTGGLTPQAARFFNIGFESVGIHLTGKPFTDETGASAVPSLEAYGGTMTRRDATTVSMEAAGEWLKKIWEVIKATWAKIKEWLKQFFTAIFDQAARYETRGRKVIEAAVRVTKQPNVSEKKKEKVSLGNGLANRLSLGDIAPATALTNLLILEATAAERGNAAKAAIAGITQDLITMGKAETSGIEGLKAKYNIEATIASGELRSSAFKNEAEHDGVAGWETDTLPGGIRLFTYNPSQLTGVSKWVGAIQNKLSGWPVKTIKAQSSDKAVDYSETTLSPEQIKSVAEDAVKVVVAFRAARDNLKPEIFGDASSLGSVNQRIDGDVPSDEEKVVVDFAKSVGKSIHQASSSISAICKYAIGTAGAYIDYANQHLKAYGDNEAVGVGAAMGRAGTRLKNTAVSETKAATDKVRSAASSVTSRFGGSKE